MSREAISKRQLLHQADFNLNSTRARQDVMRSLAQRIPTEELDWGLMLEQVCYEARTHWREGEPLVYLPDSAPPSADRFLPV